MSLITIDNVKKDYILGKTTVNALKGVSFAINEGDFISIVGPSGCGKTTLLNIIGCIDRPTQGRVFFEGLDVATLKDHDEADIRLKKIGFIFQSFNLIPVLTVFENIEFPLIINGIPRGERKKRVKELIEIVELSTYATHKPDQLSGGQRQRVAIARALVNNPMLVIADEPTANLDSVTGDNILQEMLHLNQVHKVTFIFSTHNQDVMRYAKTVIKLKDGLVIEKKNGNGAAILTEGISHDLL